MRDRAGHPRRRPAQPDRARRPLHQPDPRGGRPRSRRGGLGVRRVQRARGRRRGRGGDHRPPSGRPRVRHGVHPHRPHRSLGGGVRPEGHAVRGGVRRPTEPHLHFELWAVVDREEAGTPEWPGDTDLLPLDPTRARNAWEQRTLADEEFPGGAASSAVDRARLGLHRVPFFTAAFESTVLHPLMYAPMAADERLTIDLLRDAYSGNVDVTLRSRPSPFWGSTSSRRCSSTRCHSRLLGADLEVPCVDGRRRRYVNLDYAASTPAIPEVWAAVEDFMPWYSSVHRGSGAKSRVATEAFEGVRDDRAPVRRRAARRRGRARPQHDGGDQRSVRHAPTRHTRSRQRRAEHHANMLPWRRHDLSSSRSPRSPDALCAACEDALHSARPRSTWSP